MTKDRMGDRTPHRECLELETDLVVVAAGEAAPATVRHVEGHAVRCGRCRQELEQYRAIEDGTMSMRRYEPDGVQVSHARAALTVRLDDVRQRLVTYCVFPSPFGQLLIARSDLGVMLVEYLGRSTALHGSRLRRTEKLEVVEDGQELEGLYGELREYLEGRRTALSWPVDLRLVTSAFHRKVLGFTGSIPYGAVISYAGLAREVGNPRAVRAAAQALRWNPLPIVIPCHRVIGSSGALTGYAGGTTTRKHQLLTVEGVSMVRARGDYWIARGSMYVRVGDDYCAPTCARAAAEPAGTMRFGSRRMAEAAGLRPCSACRPDLQVEL